MTSFDFYLITAPALIGSLVMIWRLHSLKKHDRVLYKFCENRRHLMSFMREQNYDLKRQDYIALRTLQNWSDYAIHYYNERKHSMFNARRVMEEIKVLKQVDNRIKRKIIVDPKVGEIYKEFGGALFSAFVAFTPFITSEAIIRILPLLAKLLARIGISYFKHNANRIAKSLSWLQEERLSYT